MTIIFVVLPASPETEKVHVPAHVRRGVSRSRDATEQGKDAEAKSELRPHDPFYSHYIPKRLVVK
jgi:hypothetical protein